MHSRDKHHDIMTKHLTERFVYLCALGLAQQCISELGRVGDWVKVEEAWGVVSVGCVRGSEGGAFDLCGG
jgi:hypothetical protein